MIISNLKPEINFCKITSLYYLNIFLKGDLLIKKNLFFHPSVYKQTNNKVYEIKPSEYAVDLRI